MHLFWAFSTLALGGPQRRCVTLVDALGPEFRHSFHAMDGCYDALEELAPGVVANRVEAPMVKGGLLSRENLNRMRGLLADTRPDLLLTSNWGCIEWLAANKGRTALPQIHFEDGFGPDERPDQQNLKRVWARRVFFQKRGLRFVAPSNVLAEVFHRDWWVKNERISLIPNGVDCTRFANLERGAGPVTIGTVAALRREKRIDRLIEAFDMAALKRFDSTAIDNAQETRETPRLLIVGDGPERGALEQLVEQKGLSGRVEFAGNQADVAPFLAQMDIFAMSSDTEQMPISLVEAMAAGLPVAATDVGDISHMVCAENQSLVKGIEDAGQLGGSLSRLLADPILRRRLGEANALKANASYGIAAMTERYRDLFTDVVSGYSASVQITGT